ncbi:MAG: cation:proton antiporter [Dehalococcoidales bacterium]|nr:cation:proton antiporter [Dehalococcoidales bacterium]
MPGIGQGLEFIIVLGTALACGLIARRLKLPLLIGYLTGGIIVGPSVLGLVHEEQAIYAVANLGIVLLLFTLGLEFSVREIRRVGKVAVWGGVLQMVLVITIIFGACRLFNFSWIEAALFGVAVAESGTAVILKLLMERGELDSHHGRITMGLSVVQDVLIVPVVAIMPALGGEAGGMVQFVDILLMLLKAALFVAVTVALGLWALPWILGKIAGQHSRELFMLSVVTLCLATAFGTYYFGLSLAFGAFVAGLMVSQSVFARQALAEVIPLRDSFAAVFFVSLGMLFSVSFLVQYWFDFIRLLLIVIVVKAVISGFAVKVFGAGFKDALLVGIGLVPLGEFSFIMVLTGFQSSVFSPYVQSMLIAVALGSMLLTPFTLSLGSRLYLWLSQHKTMYFMLSSKVEPYPRVKDLALSHHTVICGYGDLGARLGAVLERQKFTYLVIDLDANVVSRLRERGIPCIYGDATNPEILAHAGLDKARVLVCTFTEFISVEALVRNALAINPKLDIVATVNDDEEAALLKRMGVAEVVLPPFEGSLEVVRHTLHRFGLNSTQIQFILAGLRRRVETR